MARRARRYWLMKSEPGVYSIRNLQRDGSTTWEGVRNYQARNFMRDDMAVGDLVLFYHSNADPPGVAGVARIARAAYPDPTQFNRRSRYHDPGSKKDEPRWSMVDLAFVERFEEVVPLEALRNDDELSGMLVTRRGQRLSVQPVDRGHFARVLRMGGARTRVR